jgi:hypothetical protein
MTPQEIEENMTTQYSDDMKTWFSESQVKYIEKYYIKKQDLEKDILELIGEDDNEEKNSFYGVETANTRNGLKAELRLKLKEYMKGTE